jgi:hypothetical protein
MGILVQRKDTATVGRLKLDEQDFTFSKLAHIRDVEVF